MSSDKNLKIAIIGHGNVGGTLAKGWAKSGHNITIGARNPQDVKVQSLAEGSGDIAVAAITDAVQSAEVLLIAIPAHAVSDLARKLPDVRDKIIIDATNSVSRGPNSYTTGAEAIKDITGCADVVKGFNTTGYENMANPVYNGEPIDMFAAGNSQRGKEMVKKLAKDLGFGACYDFGGDDKFKLIEQFAISWINLAIFQGEGRDIAFKVMRR